MVDEFVYRLYGMGLAFLMMCMQHKQGTGDGRKRPSRFPLPGCALAREGALLPLGELVGPLPRQAGDQRRLRLMPGLPWDVSGRCKYACTTHDQETEPPNFLGWSHIRQPRLKVSVLMLACMYPFKANASKTQAGWPELQLSTEMQIVCIVRVNGSQAIISQAFENPKW